MDLWQIPGFNAAGALAARVRLAVVWGAVFMLVWSLFAANVVAFFVANTASYCLQPRWTFRLRPQTRRRCYAASLIKLVFTGGVGPAADMFAPGSRFACVLVVIPVAITSYLMMRFWIFSPDQAAAPVSRHGA